MPSVSSSGVKRRPLKARWLFRFHSFPALCPYPAARTTQSPRYPPAFPRRDTGQHLSLVFGWLAAADTSRLELRLLKFRLEYEQELNNALASMGLGVAFFNQANFTRTLAGSSSNLAITAVKHKTYLNVNKEDPEAAAVTSRVQIRRAGQRRRHQHRPPLRRAHY